MILVTDQALAIGVTAIPSPFTQGDDDGWFCHQSFAQQMSNELTAPAFQWYPIDTKGKRVQDGSGISIALVAANAHASFGLKIYEVIRMLAQVRGTR